MKRTKFIATAVMGMLVVAFSFSFFGKQNIIPGNYYYVKPVESLVLPYPKEYNFGIDGVWLNLSSRGKPPVLKETDGLLWNSTGGKSIHVKIRPRNESNLIFLKLPTRNLENTSNPGETLNLSEGLYHFTHLTIKFPNGNTRQYSIGNLWLEILPKDKVIDEYEHLVFRVFTRKEYNPTMAIIFRNKSSKPINLIGINLPNDFPYTLDKTNFWFQKSQAVANEKRQGMDTRIEKIIKPHLFFTRRVAYGNNNFPFPIKIEPKQEVLMGISLVAKKEEVFKDRVDLNPIVLTTSDGRLISSFSGPVSSPTSY